MQDRYETSGSLATTGGVQNGVDWLATSELGANHLRLSFPAPLGHCRLDLSSHLEKKLAISREILRVEYYSDFSDRRKNGTERYYTISTTCRTTAVMSQGRHLNFGYLPSRPNSPGEKAFASIRMIVQCLQFPRRMKQDILSFL